MESTQENLDDPGQGHHLLEQARRDVALMIASVKNDLVRAAEEEEKRAEALGAEDTASLREKFEAIKMRVEQGLKKAFVQTAVAVAQELIYQKIESNELTLRVIATALKNVAEAENISLRINPNDVDLVKAHKGRFLAILTRAKDIEVREDPLVEASGVVIHTESGMIDAQPKTQLQEIEAALSA